MEVLEKTENRLVMHKSRSKVLIFMGVLFFAIGLGSFFLLAQTRMIYCERVEPRLVQCDIAASFLGIPLKTRTVDGLRMAYVNESRDSDGDSTYRVMLTGRDGDISLTTYTSSGYEDKREIADALNRFVNSNGETTVTVFDRPGFFNYLFGIIFMGVGILLFLAGLQRQTYTLDRLENSFVYNRRGLFGRKELSFALDEIANAFVEDNDNTYRPVIMLKNGEEVPLTQVYSSGRGDKEEVVSAIQEFLDWEQSGDYYY